MVQKHCATEVGVNRQLRFAYSCRLDSGVTGQNALQWSTAGPMEEDKDVPILCNKDQLQRAFLHGDDPFEAQEARGERQIGPE